MRLLALIAIVLAWAAPVAAQTKSPTTRPSAAATIDLPAEQLAATTEASRDFLHALMFDIRLLDRIADADMPTLRGNIVNSPYCAQANPSQREALNRWADSAPSVLREEFTLEFGVS
jgi:hypothetical protein